MENSANQNQVAVIEKCPTCFRKKDDPNNPQKSQWVSVCRCDRQYSPNAQFAIEVCNNCKRRVPVNAKNDIGNEHFLCTCFTPDARKIPTQTKLNDPEPVTLDLASVKINPELFPAERFTPIAILGDTPRAHTLLCRDKQRGTKVALKLFKAIPVNMLPTFESEVKKNKLMTHTNIAKIADLGHGGGKAPYTVSEYKDGFDISQCVAMYGVPSYDVAVKILIGVCEVIIYALTQGNLHRDLRPGNIIFLDDGNSDPIVCVTDFALPKVKNAEQLTSPWQTMYFSGDEARNMEYKETSEQYCLGNIGYLLLTGRPPFTEGSAMEIKNLHALTLAKRITSVNFDNDRPRDLEEVVERTMEKDPKERFDSIEKFKERLEVFPRRIQYQIDAVKAAKSKAQMIKISLVALMVLAVVSIGGYLLMHR